MDINTDIAGRFFAVEYYYRLYFAEYYRVMRQEQTEQSAETQVDWALWKRVIFHVDMDAFFASIEIRNNPELRGKPVIVGGPIDSRGVVAACSYETRPFGVHSGMPIRQALSRCPDAVVISGSLKQYGYVSSQLMNLLTKFTSQVEPFSVDEAFLDVTGSMRLHGSPVQLAKALKKTIADELELTCSIGISENKIMSKMASKLQKPDGLTVLDSKLYAERFGPKPVSVLWGIGEKSAEGIRKLGIETVNDLVSANPQALTSSLGRFGIRALALAKGIDDSEVLSLESLADEKSISHETTFPHDSLDKAYLKRALLSLSERVARRLRKGGFLARTVSIKVRSKSFKTITRDKTLATPSSDAKMIYSTARKLLPAEYGTDVAVRLLGVKAGNLIKQGCEVQLSLFDSNTEDSEKGARKRTELISAIDYVQDKYGESALKKASLVERPPE